MGKIETKRIWRNHDEVINRIKKILLSAMLLIFIYLSSYAFFSINGGPVPEVMKSPEGDYPYRFSLWAPKWFYNGPKWNFSEQGSFSDEDWYDNGQKWNKLLVTAYYPLLFLDRKYWHNKNEALAV